MDNPAFQSDKGAAIPPKKPFTRTFSTLTPTNKSWHLTQMPRSKLCRCNSVLVTKNCCNEEAENSADGPVSLDYPFFAKKSMSTNILRDNTLWTRDFWSDNYNRLHDSSPIFQKFPADKPAVATIYDPQFLSSKFGYVKDKEVRKEWWPGGWPWTPRTSGSHKSAALFCALILTLLATVNIIYILKSVEKPVQQVNKSAWVDIVLINGEFKILNEPYLPTYSNHTSEDFQHLSNIISHKLDSLFSLSVISEPYHSTAVSELLPGLLVRCQIVLHANSQVSATKVGLAFIGGLRNQHGHVWLGNSSVDIQSIGFQASLDAVSWTEWSEWGECEETQEFGFVQIRSRNCTLRSGQYLHSTLPCLLVPHSHSNIETAPCTPSLPQDPLMAAESSVDMVQAVSLSDRFLRLQISPVHITRENCTKNKNGEESTTGGIEITTSLLTTTEQPIKNTSISLCTCSEGQVCVSLEEGSALQCLPVVDAADPTGCGGHCQINTQLCQKIRDNAYRCIDDTKCLEDEWQCGNRLCIPISKRCDGHFNCYDHTDEQNCNCNLTSHFQCGKRMSCLPLTKRCDAVVDCWDATDELNCTIHCIGAEQFTCNDSQCIPNHKFCDGFPDCKDHSDEPFGCGGDCKTHEWRCSNSRCVPQKKRCDGTDDCGDSSDEQDCSKDLPV